MKARTVDPANEGRAESAGSSGRIVRRTVEETSIDSPAVASVLARGAIVVLAALVVAWVVLGYQSVGLEEDGEKLATRAAFGKVADSEIDEGIQDLRRAGRFRADNTPLITEGSLLFASRRSRQAAAIARQATEEEPDNIEAWFLAYSIATDAAAKQEAKRQVARLNPWAGDDLP